MKKLLGLGLCFSLLAAAFAEQYKSDGFTVNYDKKGYIWTISYKGTKISPQIGVIGETKTADKKVRFSQYTAGNVKPEFKVEKDKTTIHVTYTGTDKQLGPLMQFDQTVVLTPHKITVNVKGTTLTDNSTGLNIYTSYPVDLFAGKYVHNSRGSKDIADFIYPEQYNKKFNMIFTDLSATTPAGYFRIKRTCPGWVAFWDARSYKVNEVNFCFIGLDKFGKTERKEKGAVFEISYELSMTDTAPEAAYFLPLKPFMNFDYADKKANDGKGGWHDQGSSSDARRFPFNKVMFANIPFKTVNPAQNNGKGIIVFRNPRKQDGVREVKVSVPNVPAKYLYLLHSTAWGQTKGTELGTVFVTDKAGVQRRLGVVYGIDTSDWYSMAKKDAPNAVPGVQFAADIGSGAAYVSKFEIPKEVGPIAQVSISVNNDAKAWWMLLGATVSNRDYVRPKKTNMVIMPNDIWKPVPGDTCDNPDPGTVLDLTQVYDNKPCGTFGRVIINKNGHFAFEKKPDTPVRFVGVSTGMNKGFMWNPKLDCKKEAEGIARAGYNVVLWWSGHLFNWNKVGLDVDPKQLDFACKMLAELKKQGVYIFLSISGAEHIRYENWRWLDTRNDSLFNDPENVKAWKRGVKRLLHHVNPYTGIRIIDDPQIAYIDCNNEIEFDFARADNKFAGIWREFLRKKYGTFDKLAAAWGDSAKGLKSFDDIKTVPSRGNNTPIEKDRQQFQFEAEYNLLKWEKAYLRELGYKGPVSTFRMGKDFNYIKLRNDLADYTAMNSYAGHPTNNWRTVAHISPISTYLMSLRGVTLSNLYGKPTVSSEHCFSFWCHYQYEQGLTTGAIAALNSIDALNVHQFELFKEGYKKWIGPMDQRVDPIGRAAEVQSNLLFRRGDVRTSDKLIRLHVDGNEIVNEAKLNLGPDPEQLKLSLIFPFKVDFTTKPAKKNERVIERVGGSAVTVRSQDTSLVDGKSEFNLERALGNMKKDGFLPESNRSNAKKGILESVTGELYMDAGKMFFSVNTPRTQGACVVVGQTAALDNFKIVSVNRDGSFSVSSVDRSKGIAESKRLLLIVMTRCLNSGMMFEDAEMTTKIKDGKAPVLLETGVYKFEIKNKNIGKMKLYPVEQSGKRLAPVPFTVKGDTAQITLETAKYPTVYFELSEK